jgi:hypothetical protein
VKKVLCVLCVLGVLSFVAPAFAATVVTLNGLDIQASGLSGASAIPNGSTATKQTDEDGSTDIATDSYADSQFVIAGSGLTPGAAYYLNGASLALAEANSAATLPAICIATKSTVCRKFGHWTTTGLTAGAIYYVSPSVAGGITATQPGTAGQFIQQIGVASSTTQLEIMPALAVEDL